MFEKIYIRNRVNALKLRAAQKYNIAPEKCHIGHLVLQGMLDNAKMINQIDAATNQKETNGSVALRSMRLASALQNYGLMPGDVMVVMGPNHLDMAIPYYAGHFIGLSLCGIDPNIGPADLKGLFPYITPKITFCQRNAKSNVEEAYAKAKVDGKIIIFDDDENNMKQFIQEYNGSERNFRPAEFDHTDTAAWLMLTSGTTGEPKVAVIPFDRLLHGVCCWWEPFTIHFEVALTMSTFQWLSSLMYFISGPLRRYTRLQSSVPFTPQLLVSIINKYKPNLTAWTPHLLSQFLHVDKAACDMSCFKYIVISGSPIEKTVLDKFKERCDAFLYLVYGMTELLVPGFDFREETPFGSVGKPYEKYKYKLADDQGHCLNKPFKTGELWIKGDAFFKGYLGNPHETRKMLTEDGWFKTGDLFYRDNDDYYYFVERKRLLIKCAGYWISPLQLEEIIKRHPSVDTACVVGIPDKYMTEVPVAAIVLKNGHNIDNQEIFDLVKESMPELRQLHGGFFYMDTLPITPTGKLHRAKVKNIALTSRRILPIS